MAELFLERLGMTADEAQRAPVQTLVDTSQEVFDHVPSTRPGLLAFAPTVDGGDLVPDYPVKLARAGKTHPVPLLIGTNKNEAALFRLMRSPLMPIAPKGVRTMFGEMANDQPGLQLPTAEQISAAYPAKMARTRSLGVASDVASGCRRCGSPRGGIPRWRRCTSTGSIGPHRFSRPFGWAQRMPRS